MDASAAQVLGLSRSDSTEHIPFSGATIYDSRLWGF